MKLRILYLLLFLLAVCSAHSQFSVSVQSPVYLSGYNVTSNAANDGTATAFPFGGNAPYTYLWSNGGTAQTIGGLAAGTYCLTVTDMFGNTAGACVTLIEPPVVTCVTPTTTVLCDNAVFNSVGNGIVQIDSTSQGKRIVSNFTCTNPLELYGFQMFIPPTRHLGMEFETRHRQPHETFLAYHPSSGDIDLGFSLRNNSIILHSSIFPLLNNNVKIYLHGDSVGALVYNGAQIQIAGGDSISGFDIDFDTSSSELKLTLIFDTTFTIGVAPTLYTGDELMVVIPSNISIQFDTLQYLVGGALQELRLVSISTSPRMAMPVDTFSNVPSPPPLPTAAPGDPFVYVSQDLMDALIDWSMVADSNGPVLMTYLQQVSGLDTGEVNSYMEHFECSPNTYCPPCRCVPTSVDPAPTNLVTTDTPDHQDDDRKWYFNWTSREMGLGAAYRNHIFAYGHLRPGEKYIESVVHSTYYDLEYVCLDNAGLRKTCCTQTVNLRVRYDSKQEVYNWVRGVNKESAATAEDAAYLYTYNRPPSSTAIDVQVLAAQQAGVTNAVSVDLNPTFWIGVVQMAAGITTVLVGDGLHPDNILAIQNALTAMINNPAWKQNGSEGSFTEALSLIYDGSLALLPNVPRTIRLDSKGKVLGRGRGGNWEAEAKISGNLVMVVKTLANPDPQCCLRGSARWSVISYPEAPYGVQTLRDLVGGFLYPERPWFDGVTQINIPANIGDGRMVINNNFGLAFDANECPPPCQVESANLSSGRNANSTSVLSPPNRDPNWKLVMAPSQTVPTDAYVIYRNSLWSLPPSGCQWLSNIASGAASSEDGDYDYERTFCLNSVDPSLSLDIQFLCDNVGSVSLNNHAITVSQQATQSPVIVHITEANLFVLGSNTLTVSVDNSEAAHGFAMKAILSACPGVICSPITALDPDEGTFPGVSLNPNPTDNLLHVAGVPNNSKVKYTVTNMWGQILQESDSPDLDVHALAAGMYFLRVESKEGSKVIRFVKH